MTANADQTVANATWTTINMNLLAWDFMGNALQTGDEQIVVKRAGIYLIMGRVEWAANNVGSRFVGWALNGASTPVDSYGPYLVTGSFTSRPGFSAMASLDIGDTVELQGYQNSGGNLSTDSNADATAYLIVTLISSNLP